MDSLQERTHMRAHTHTHTCIHTLTKRKVCIKCEEGCVDVCFNFYLDSAEILKNGKRQTISLSAHTCALTKQQKTIQAAPDLLLSIFILAIYSDWVYDWPKYITNMKHGCESWFQQSSLFFSCCVVQSRVPTPHQCADVTHCSLSCNSSSLCRST